MSVLLSVHPEVQRLSVAPQHEQDGAWLSGRCKVLERKELVNMKYSQPLVIKLTVAWGKRSGELVQKNNCDPVTKQNTEGQVSVNK